MGVTGNFAVKFNEAVALQIGAEEEEALTVNWCVAEVLDQLTVVLVPKKLDSVPWPVGTLQK